MILNLGHNTVDVILLGSSEGIQGGDLVTATGERLKITVGHNIIGRIVDPLANPIDDRGPIEATETWFIEQDAPGIVERAPVNVPLLSGWKMIDALVPIGRGQRELIIGDRQTGKTTLAVDTIINQKDSGVACFYVAIGQKKSTTLSVIEILQHTGALEYTTVVISSPDDPPALRYIAPYAGCTMAESVMKEGRDVLIVYDDLTKHADAYRELSLLLRRPPGREAYPGDIFYLHSRLLERACKLNDEYGGGSLTALPIVETQRGNVAAYIPTNLISITDGQILLDSELFNRGIKPAIDVGRSVSRVGGAAQVPAMRQQAANLRLELAQYEEVARFARFGTEVDESTQQQIQRGQRWQSILMQSPHTSMPLGVQIFLLVAAVEGQFDDIALSDLREFEGSVIQYVEREIPSLLSHIERTGELSEDSRKEIVDIVSTYRNAWRGARSDI
jgi:F-type H+-transporting ATPase subunit alpha